MNVTRYASKRCLSPLRCCNQNIIISDDISRCVSPIRYLGSRPILDSEINKTFGIETKSKRIEKRTWKSLQEMYSVVIRQTLTSMYTGEKPVHLPRVLRGLIPRVSNANNCDHNSENKARARPKRQRDHMTNELKVSDAELELPKVVPDKHEYAVFAQLERIQSMLYGKSGIVFFGGKSVARDSKAVFDSPATSPSQGSGGEKGNKDPLPGIFNKKDNNVKQPVYRQQPPVTHPKLTLPRRVPWTYKDVLPGAMSLVTDMFSKSPNKSATVKQSIGGSSRHHNQHTRRTDVDKLARDLVNQLRPLVLKKRAQPLNACLKSLNDCLLRYERARSAVFEAKAIPLFLRSLNSPDIETRRLAHSNLALLGHTRSPRGRGIRILSLDGGGTRGLVTIQIMKQLESETGLPIYKLFDFICGVSTGSLIAVMIGAFKIPLDTVEEIYKEFSTQMFQRGKFFGTGTLVTSHAYYDTQLWQDILTYNFEDMKFSDSMKESDLPKLAAISSLTNLEKIQCYVFRNYNFASGVQSHYMGNSNHKYWEAIRASSAAPGYYEELRIDNLLHQDGGILMNNPTPIAIHESKLLWPKESLQCVLSIGTGRYASTIQTFAEGMSSSLKDRVYKIVQSATDTEAQHTILHDLLDPECYYRINPYLSSEYGLDEVRPEKWEQMSQDTELYLRRNIDKMNDLVAQLMLPRRPLQRFSDCVDKQKHSMGY